MNYKGLAYKTVWVEFPEIEAVSLKYGVGPTTKKPDGSPSYTVPLIYDPSTKVAVAESIAIAKYLDVTYPNTPQVFPPRTDALQAAFSLAAPVACGDPLFMLTIARIWATLNVESQAYFRRTREERFGAKLEDLYGEEQWVLLEEGFGKVDKWLQGNGPGKGDFVMGDKITYADFQLSAILMWARTVFGPDSEEWKTIAGWHGGKWKRWIEYFDQYAAVDS